MNLISFWLIGLTFLPIHALTKTSNQSPPCSGTRLEFRSSIRKSPRLPLLCDAPIGKCSYPGQTGSAVAKTRSDQFPPSSSVTDANIQEPRAINFKTGLELRKALAAVTSITQKNQDIRSLLKKMSSDFQIAIFLDRRIDPGQLINITIKNKTVLQSLYLIADEVKSVQGKYRAAVIQIEDVIYVGPRPAASRFYFEYKKSRANLNKIKNRLTRQNWLRRDSLAWPRLARPRDLATDIVKENEIDLHGALDLPHDLWASGEICKTSVIARLSLLATGFGKTLNVDDQGSSFQLVKSPRMKRATDTYPTKQVSNLEALIQEIPGNPTVRKKANSIEVIAPPGFHYQVRRTIVLNQKLPSISVHPDAQKRASMDTEARIGDILNTVANQLKIKLEFDPKLNEILQKRIKISVKQVSYEQLVAKALESTDLSFELNKQKLIIRK